MTFPDIGQLMSVALNQMRETARQTVISASLMLLAGIILLAGTGFGFAAVTMHLSSIMLPLQAAGLIALGLFTIAILLLIVTLCRDLPHQVPTRQQAAERQPAATATQPFQTAMDDCTRAATDMVHRHPTSSLITALAAGAIIGLVRPRS